MMHARPLLLLLLFFAIGAGLLDGYHLLQRQRFNNALLQEQAIAGDDAHARLAAAYRAQQQQQWQQAISAYETLRQHPKQELRHIALFNLATLYLSMGESKLQQDPEQAVPLIELAKAEYRRLLHQAENHWGGRYNLEYALYLLPDSRTEALSDEINPERSPRAPTSIEIEYVLP